jgi:hypothetical protein
MQTTKSVQTTKRKFSQSCNSKQDFFDLLVELRDTAEKTQYDPENTFRISARLWGWQMELA